MSRICLDSNWTALAIAASDTRPFIIVRYNTEADQSKVYKRIADYDGTNWSYLGDPYYRASCITNAGEAPHIVRAMGRFDKNNIPWSHQTNILRLNRSSDLSWDTIIQNRFINNDNNKNPLDFTLGNGTHFVVASNNKIYNHGSNGWTAIDTSAVFSGAIAIASNATNLYAVDEATQKVYKKSFASGVWDAEPLLGDRKAIKIAVSDYFVCIIDRFNQICVHNGSYWEVLEEYGLATDIAIVNTKIYMIDKFDHHVYEITSF